ncbi:MAG: hypothetical protein R3F42_12370 [Pseudomonadota bacterium]
MGKKTVPDLKELFKQASEIAQQVPESMQEAAFNRAIDLLTGGAESAPQAEQPSTQTVKEKKAAKKSTQPEREDSSLDDLVSAIDSTQHPGVTSATKVLDRSLMILQIALTDHDKDGLTPSEIAKILTEKFRVGTTRAAVSMALGNATTLVNRVKDGPGYKYRIMAPGDEYLAHLDEPDSVSPSSAKKSRKKKVTTKSATTKKQSSKKKSKTSNKSNVSQPKKSAIGPKAAVSTLMESGYFSTARTGPEVQAYLKSKRGFHFGTDQLRLAMLRLVREEKLERDENDDGQYEYKQPKP